MDPGSENLRVVFKFDTARASSKPKLSPTRHSRTFAERVAGQVRDCAAAAAPGLISGLATRKLCGQPGQCTGS